MGSRSPDGWDQIPRWAGAPATLEFWVRFTAPKVPLDAADGDEAESVRARFRERVSSPCGEVAAPLSFLRPAAYWDP